MTKINTAFFVNPLSHSVAKNGSVLDQSCLDDDVLRVKLDDFENLPNGVIQAIKNEVDTICIEGGDGTIQGVLTEVLNRVSPNSPIPNIVLLSGGMTNVIAANIGIKKPTPQGIEKILENPGHADQTILPVLKISPSDNGKTQYGFLFSTGALPAATEFCLDQIHTKGIGGAKAVRHTLFHALLGKGDVREKILSKTPIKLDFAETALDEDHLTSVATTLPKLMIGIQPFWGTGDGPVHLTYAGPPIKHKVRNVARMFKRTHSERAIASMSRDGFQSWRIRSAKIDHSGPMILDGEFLPRTQGSIELSATLPLTFLR